LNKILYHNVFIYGKNQIKLIINKLTKELKQRENALNSKNKTIFFFVFGLHRARELKSEDGFSYPEITEDLFYIIRNGPDFGIHIICWGDTLKNIERILERNISEFDLRVALQMSLMDSNEFIETADANKLGRYRALLYNEEKVGVLEKFRPYRLPSNKWFNFLQTQLKKIKQKPNK